MSSDNYIALVEQLKAARMSKQLTQGTVADRLGVPRTQVAHWEGRTKFPSVGILLRWANCLGCELQVGMKG